MKDVGGTLEIEPSERTVSLSGRLDARTVEGTVERLLPHLPGDDDARLDLSQLDSIDEEGLAAIRTLADGLPEGSRLVLLFPNVAVRAALVRSRLVGSGSSGRVVVAPEDEGISLQLRSRPLSRPRELPFVWLG